jgi:hypothetical protein
MPELLCRLGSISARQRAAIATLVMRRYMQ